MTDLVLAVKAEYFEAIKNGTKQFENRRYNDYWKKRLQGRLYDHLVITLGYPKKDDHAKRLVFKYQPPTVKTIKHKEFGTHAVKVFALPIGKRVS